MCAEIKQESDNKYKNLPLMENKCNSDRLNKMAFIISTSNIHCYVVSINDATVLRLFIENASTEGKVRHVAVARLLFATTMLCGTALLLRRSHAQ